MRRLTTVLPRSSKAPADDSLCFKHGGSFYSSLFSLNSFCAAFRSVFAQHQLLQRFASNRAAVGVQHRVLGTLQEPRMRTSHDRIIPAGMRNSIMHSSSKAKWACVLPCVFVKHALKYQGCQRTTRSTTWVVVKSMVPFWVPNIVGHLIFRVPKKGP